MDAISTRPIGVRTFDPVLTLGLLHRRSTTEISPEGIPVSSRLVKRTPGMYRGDAWGSSLRALPKRPFRHLPRAPEACVRRTDPLPGFAGTPPASWGRNPRPLGPPGHSPSKLGENSKDDPRTSPPWRGSSAPHEGRAKWGKAPPAAGRG